MIGCEEHLWNDLSLECFWLRISPPRIKLGVWNFVRRFIGIWGWESPIFVNFAPPEAQNRTNRPARPCCNVMLLGFCDSHAYQVCAHVDVGSACVDIRQSPKTDVVVVQWFAVLIFSGDTVIWGMGYMDRREERKPVKHTLTVCVCCFVQTEKTGIEWLKRFLREQVCCCVLFYDTIR